MKKKMSLLCLAAVLVMTAAIGGTFAGFNTKTDEQATARITTKSFSIKINDTTLIDEDVPLGNTIDTVGDKDVVVMPGAKIPFSKTIENDADYDLYARVTIYKYWDNRDLDSSKIGLVLNESDANWMKWYEDDEQVILYYARPLKAKAADGTTDSSQPMLTGVEVSKDIDNKYVDANIMLEFEVDAVQCLAAEDAMISEWGVYPEFDGDGNIISIAE